MPNSKLRTKNSKLACPVAREIRELRRLIRDTRKQVNTGAIDPVKGGHLISRSCNSVARLLLASHRIALNPLPDPRLAEVQSDIDRILRELRYDSED